MLSIGTACPLGSESHLSHHVEFAVVWIGHCKFNFLEKEVIVHFFCTN